MPFPQTDAYGNPIRAGSTSPNDISSQSSAVGSGGGSATDTGGGGFADLSGRANQNINGGYQFGGAISGGPGLAGLNSGYGSSAEVADPGTFWRNYVNQIGGVPGYNSSTAYLSAAFPDPIKLMMGLSPGNTQQMSTERGALLGEQALAGFLGGTTKFFNPGDIIRNVLQQASAFDPQKGSSGPGGMLGLSTYDSDPVSFANNLANYLLKILPGITPPDTMKAIQNALTIAVSDMNARATQGKNSLGGPNVDSRQVPGMLMHILQQFGVM